MRCMEEFNFALEPYLTFWKCTLQRPQQASHWHPHVLCWSLVAFWDSGTPQLGKPKSSASLCQWQALKWMAAAHDPKLIAHPIAVPWQSSPNCWAKLLHEQLPWCFYVKPNAERWTCSSRSCYPSQYPLHCFTATSFLFALMLCPKLMGFTNSGILLRFDVGAFGELSRLCRDWEFLGMGPDTVGGHCSACRIGFKVAFEIPGKSTSSSLCSSLFLVPLLLETLPKN